MGKKKGVLNGCSSTRISLWDSLMFGRLAMGFANVWAGTRVLIYTRCWCRPVTDLAISVASTVGTVISDFIIVVLFACYLVMEKPAVEAARLSLIPSLCTHFTRAGIEWRR